MAFRFPITLAEEDGSGFLKMKKGATLKLYKYDSGQPNNRGALVGTFLEVPANSGKYYIDVSSGTDRFVVTITDGSESNLPQFDGIKLYDLVGTTELQNSAVTNPKIASNAVNTANIVDQAVTVEKTNFGKTW